MKKFLSLVLALVMTMSLVTVSAGAKDFTDSSKINYTEAVDVMSAVKVIDGYTDGSFNPSATLTRGAAAKIICNLILGPTTASALVADAAPYSDVPTNHTFAGYIAYCQKEGIISGYADGTFKPANSLTGYAFMKMLLGALGYKAEQEGYTGPNWSINVAKRAMNIGLKDGLKGDFNGVKAVTREEACLYAFNTLQATMVEYEKNSTVTVGNITIKDTSDAKEVVNNVRADNTIKDDGKMQFAEKYFTDLKLDEGSDDFGRPANTWKVKNTEVGTFVNTSDLVATYTEEVTAADIYAAVGKTVYDDLTAKKNASELTVFVDGEEKTVSDVKDYVVKNDTKTVNSTDNGDLTEVYVDDDSNVIIVTVRTYVFQAANDYNSKKETVELTTAGDTSISLSDKTLSADDYDIADIKADDYILVNAAWVKGNVYEVKEIAKAELVTADVDGYKVQKNVTMGSTTYKYSSTTLSSGEQNKQFTVGQKATVVLDKYGYIIAVDQAIVSSDYVYVSEFAKPAGLSNGKVVAHAYFTDGTTDDITVKDLLGNSSKTNMVPSGSTSSTAKAGWYTFSKNSAGEYSLYQVEGKYTTTTSSGTTTKNQTTYTYTHTASVEDVMEGEKVTFLKKGYTTSSSSTPATSAPTVYANNDTIVIVDDGNDVTVYTGVKNLPDITLKTGAANVTTLTKGNNYAYYVFVSVPSDASISGSSDETLTYFVKYDGKFKGADNDIYYTYKTLDANGEEVVVKADGILNSKDASDKDIYGVWYKTRTNSDKELTSATPLTSSTGKYIAGSVTTETALSTTAGALLLDGTRYTTADDAKITLVVLKTSSGLNKDKEASYEVTTGLTAKSLSDTLKGYNVAYTYAGKVTDTNGTNIEELFVTVTSATYTGSTAGATTTADIKGALKVEVDATNGAVKTTHDASANLGLYGNDGTANVDLTKVVVTFEISTWDSTTGRWNAPETVESTAADFAAGQYIDVSAAYNGAAVGAKCKVTVSVSSKEVTKTIGTVQIAAV